MWPFIQKHTSKNAKIDRIAKVNFFTKLRKIKANGIWLMNILRAPVAIVIIKKEGIFSIGWERKWRRFSSIGEKRYFLKETFFS